MKYYKTIWFCLLFWGMPLATAQEPTGGRDGLFASGSAAFEEGRYTEAYDAFSRLATLSEDQGDLLTSARSHYNSGHARSSEMLFPASNLAETFSGSRGTSVIAISVGSAREAGSAVSAFLTAANVADRAGDDALGLLATTQALRLARASGDDAETRRILDLGYARAESGTGTLAPAALVGFLNEAVHAAAVLNASLDVPNALRQRLNDVIDSPEGTIDQGVRAFAMGVRARLSLVSGQSDSGLSDTLGAISLSDGAEDYRQLFLWQAQMAAIHQATGNFNAALERYESAFESLELARALYGYAERLDERQFFSDEIRPVLDIYVDLLLRGTGQPGAEEVSQALEAVNLLRRLELEQYLADVCRPAEASVAVGEADPGAAIIYPVLAGDSVDIIVSLNGALIHRPAEGVTADAVVDAAIQLRTDLVRRGTRNYQASASTLYQALIAPIASDLERAGVSRLVFSMDGELRLVPPAVLWDGERHLIERYSIALAPDLTLRGARAFDDAPKRGVFLGLSDAVEGFSPLPAVPNEISRVADVLPGATPRLDGDFTRAGARDLLTETDPTVLHIATHGEFGGTNETSFLLTHDGRLPMAEFGELVSAIGRDGTPLELIVLSACQTAEGDERSVLGLAGMALRTGAKAAVGSLWSVPDQSTADLQAAFYRELAAPGDTKADALRAAQLEVMAQEGTRHPYYWAAFVLVGNWL